MAVRGKIRLAIWFAIEGDIRFLSHRDTLRLFMYALNRIGCPVRFSEGFNPHPRLSLCLPRSVGVSSKAELLVVEMMQQVDRRSLQRDLQNTLPDGIIISGLHYIPEQVSVQPEWADYEIHLNETSDWETIHRNIERFNASNSISIQRERHGRHPGCRIDLHKSVVSLRLVQNIIHCRIMTGQGVTARLDEILRELQLDSPVMVNEIQRCRVNYPCLASGEAAN